MIGLLCDLADSIGCKRLSELGGIPASELNLRLVNLAMKKGMTWDAEKIAEFEAAKEKQAVEAFKQRARAKLNKNQGA